MAVDARHHGSDRRQVDMIVCVELGLILGREPMVAMRARLGPRLDHLVGVFGQGAGHAGTTLPLRRPPLRAVGLLRLAGRYRRIFRRLRRLAELRLQISQASFKQRYLICQFGDHVRLRQDQRDQVFLAKLL